MKIEAIIFDQDGVLIDSEPIHFLVLEKFFKIHGYRYELPIHEKFFGYNAHNFFTQLHKEHGFQLPIEYMKTESRKYIHDFENRINLMPAVVSTLNELSELIPAIGLATGTYRELTERNLNRLRIKHYFKHTMCGDEVENGKPHPEIYLKTAQKLNCRPQECLVIEDAPAGIEAARQAGMQVVSYHTAHNKSADLSNAHHKIDHLSQIAPLIKNLNKNHSNLNLGR